MPRSSPAPNSCACRSRGKAVRSLLDVRCWVLDVPLPPPAPPNFFHFPKNLLSALPGSASLPRGMKLRKRHKIVVLFWIPFWTLTAAFAAGVSWMAGWMHF